MAAVDKNLNNCYCRKDLDAQYIVLDEGSEEEFLQVIVEQESVVVSSISLPKKEVYEPLKAKRSKESCCYDFYTQSEEVDKDKGDEDKICTITVKAGVEQVRLHWPLLGSFYHSLAAAPIPALNLPTRGGRWLWREWGHNRIADSAYVKQILSGVNNTILLFHVHQHPHFEEVYLPELLLRLKQLDVVSVAHFLKISYLFFSRQKKILSICFDNARLNEFQAAVIITGLARGSGNYTKYLYTWNICEFKIEDATSTLFTDSIKLFTNLSLLCINYSVLGNRCEGLDVIKHLIGGTKKTLILQLLVQSLREGEISETRWRQTVAQCPGLIIRMLIVLVPRYREIKRFFSKWMPLQEVCIYCGWETKDLHAWCIECLFKMFSIFYGEKLERIYLQICRQPEMLNLCNFFAGGRPSLNSMTYHLPNYQYPREFLLPALKKLEILTNMELEDVKKLCKLIITSRTRDEEVMKAEKEILSEINKMIREIYFEKKVKNIEAQKFRVAIIRKIRNRLRLMEAKELLKRYKQKNLPANMFYNTIYKCAPDENIPEYVTKISEKNVWQCPPHCLVESLNSSTDTESDKFTFYEPKCEQQFYEEYKCNLMMDEHEKMPSDPSKEKIPFAEEDVPPRPPSIALETLVLRLYPPFSTTVRDFEKMVNDVYDEYAQKLKDYNIKFRLDVINV